jgi:hypothetical protein
MDIKRPMNADRLSMTGKKLKHTRGIWRCGDVERGRDQQAVSDVTKMLDISH